MSSRQLRFYLAMAVAAPLLVLVEVWPWHPHSGLGWALLVAFSVPILAVAAGVEKVAEWDPIAARIDRATKHKEVSGLRMAYLLGKILLIFGVVVAGALVIAKLWLIWRAL